MILVSFDGPEAIHDECRGLKGAFQTAVRGINALSREKKKQRKKKPYILTSTTLSMTNAHCLEDTFSLCKDLLPDIMVVYLSWFTNEQIGKEHACLLKDELGVDAYTWKSYAREFLPQEAKLLQDAVARVKNIKWPFPFMIIPDLNEKEIARYYLEPQERFGFQRCAAPFFMLDIMPNGDVVTCRDFIDVKVGNIKNTPVLDIWNNEAFMRFRRLLISKNGTLPQCSRCCGLMGF
jgi:radical SAM protein with 4Fe4S-binding SPASM domain